MINSLFQFTLNITGTQGIPTNVREYLLQHDRGETALILDICYFLGWTEGHKFTVNELIWACEQINLGISTGLLRRGLKDDLIEEIGSIKGRGRPSVIYCLTGIRELVERATYDKWFGATDVLQLEDLLNMRSYRKALHIIYLERCPGEYSRRWLGNRLGVSARATLSYEDGSRIRVIARFVRKKLRHWLKVPVKVMRRSMYYVEIVKNDVKQRMPYCQEVVRRGLEKGAEVYKCCRGVNRYEPMGN